MNSELFEKYSFSSILIIALSIFLSYFAECACKRFKGKVLDERTLILLKKATAHTKSACHRKLFTTGWQLVCNNAVKTRHIQSQAFNKIEARSHTTNTEPTSKSAYHGFFSFGTAHRRAVGLTTFIAVCWFLLCQAAGPKSVRRRCFFPPTAACPRGVRNRPINSLSGCVFAQQRWRAPLRPKDVHFRVSTAPLYVYLRE